MDTGGEEKAIRVISFSGQKKDWAMWEEKFLAKARRRDYKDVLLGKATIPKESDALNTDEKKKVAKLNELAYEDLILAIDGSTEAGRVAFQVVKGSKSKDYPNGNAAVSWSRLSTKYAAKTTPSLLWIKRELLKCVLKDGREDPDVWITKLEDYRAQINEMVEESDQMSEKEMMIHILNNVPKAYDIEVAKFEDKLEEDKLTLEDL